MVLRVNLATVVVEMVVLSARDLRGLNVVPKNLGESRDLGHDDNGRVPVHGLTHSPIAPGAVVVAVVQWLPHADDRRSVSGCDLIMVPQLLVRLITDRRFLASPDATDGLLFHPNLRRSSWFCAFFKSARS